MTCKMMFMCQIKASLLEIWMKMKYINKDFYFSNVLREKLGPVAFLVPMEEQAIP